MKNFILYGITNTQSFQEDQNQIDLPEIIVTHHFPSGIFLQKVFVSIIPIVVTVFIWALGSEDAAAQRVRYSGSPSILQNWSVSVGGGALSYYGDLSLDDYTVFKKLKNESGPAFSMLLSKKVFRSFWIGGQVIGGKMTYAKDNLSFDTRILEYNLQSRLNMLDLLMGRKVQRRYGAVAFAGIGNFIYKTTRIKKENERNLESIHQSKVPEFVYFFGAGLSYKITPRISASVDLSIRQCQNDNVDATIRNLDYDYYSYLNIGLSYTIFDLGNDSLYRGSNIFGWGNVVPRYRPNGIYNSR
ncbi:MAG: hypothetical protein KDC05_14595 [Bacteroidales bacterium]|nr:hypothetical protein [Bacteroidales bacterium]